MIPAKYRGSPLRCITGSGAQAAASRLARIRRDDTRVKAWVALDEQLAVVEAERLDAELEAQGRSLGPLHGMSVGVKDNIDVAGFPTRAGSRSRSEIAAVSRDAAVVTMLREAGALILGKTATTEFAYRDPAGTRNPYDLRHTPGGSSSGSAAAVAAGMVPIALGTQTAASVCRPAAYCGIASFKPTYQTVPMTGVLPLAQSFDTIGFFARHVIDLIGLSTIVCRRDETTSPETSMGPREPVLAVPESSFYPGTPEPMLEFLAATVRHLAAGGVRIETISQPFGAAKILKMHRTVMLGEMAANYASLLARPDLLGWQFREAVEQGCEFSGAQIKDARHALRAARDQLWRKLTGFDAILLLPVPEPAPIGLGSTGDQRLIAPWTAMQGPLVTMPVRLAGNGLPLSIMLAADPHADQRLLGVAAAMQPRLDRLPEVAPGFD